MMGKIMKCSICGKEISKSLFNGAILCSDECFNKDFWNKIVLNKQNHIIVNGLCYCDAGDAPNGKYLGYAGRRFYIRFNDGHEITTNNLWYQGKIPDEYRSQLPDNAVFYHENINVEGGVNY